MDNKDIIRRQFDLQAQGFSRWSMTWSETAAMHPRSKLWGITFKK